MNVKYKWSQMDKSHKVATVAAVLVLLIIVANVG
jgi:hypothetical protein